MATRQGLQSHSSRRPAGQPPPTQHGPTRPASSLSTELSLPSRSRVPGGYPAAPAAPEAKLPTTPGLKSDYADYGKPWLQAAAKPIPGPYGDGAVTSAVPAHPKYTQGREPSPVVPGSFAGSQTSTVYPKTYDPEVYVRGTDHAAGVARPRSAVSQQSTQGMDRTSMMSSQQALKSASSSTASTAGVNRPATSKANGKQSYPADADLTSDQVRDAVFSHWLAQKSTKSKSSSLKPQTSKQSTRSSSKPATRVLTPEELFQDSSHVRQAAYEDWMAKKLANTQARKRAEDEQKAELMATTREQEKQKKDDAQLAFEAWKSQKDDTLAKKKAEQKRAEREKQQQEEKEAKEKRTEAESAFMAWKAPKDGKLKETLQEKRKRQREEEARAAEEREDTMKTSERAFQGWKSRKDTKLQEETRRQRQQEQEDRRHRDQLAKEKAEQTALAMKSWNEQKEISLSRSGERCSLSPRIEARMVWSPPGAGDGGVLRRSISPI